MRVATNPSAGVSIFQSVGDRVVVQPDEGEAPKATAGGPTPPFTSNPPPPDGLHGSLGNSNG